MVHRPSITTVLAATLAAFVLGACGFTPLANPTGGPTSTPTPTVARAGTGSATGSTGTGPITGDGSPSRNVANANAQRFGFNPGSGILWMDDDTRQRELDAIAATGARWIALDFDWNSIQGDGPDSFRWDRSTDTVVREAHARGLRIVGSLAYSPPWARRAECAETSHCLPANPATFARFAQASAQRYGRGSLDPELRGSVAVWQIWNEANHVPFVQPTVDIAGYTTILQQAYRAIKSVDRDTTVLAGATAPAGDDPNGLDVAPVTFLRGIYEHGGKGSFDAFAHHPYTFPYSPLDEAPWNAYTQTRDLHRVMVEHGDGAKKIWATEAGAGTGTNAKAVTASRQAQILRDYITGWNGEFRSFTGPLLWFSVRDAGTDPASVYDNFGILRHDFQPKPARSVLIALLHTR